MHVNFFAIEADMKALMGVAEEQRLLVMPVSYPVETGEPQPVSPLDYEITDAQFCFLPKEFTLEDIVYIEGQKGKKGIAMLDRDESPVIVCAPPVQWGTKLDGGHLDVEGEAAGHKFSLVERRYDFLMRAIKKWARTDKNQGYVGPAAEKLVREKRLQLGLGKRSVTLW
jgi:hypothetical protein